jgi:hypothetical protein
MVGVGRDQTWAAMWNLADRMNRRYADTTLHVRPRRRRLPLRWRVIDQLEAADNWTFVVEPVRRRWLFGRGWDEIQPVKEAASKIGQFIRERPDQEGRDRS